MQSTNSSDINSSFLSEAAASVDKNLQTPIGESSVTNSVVSNIEIPSENPTFETLAIFIQISTPLNLNPTAMIRYTFRKLTSIKLNLMLSEVLLLVKYLI